MKPTASIKRDDRIKVLSNTLAAAQILHSYCQANLAALQQMAYLGIWYSAATIHQEAKILSSNPVPPKGEIEKFRIRKLFHEVSRDAAKAVVDAAAIVFAHSVLDATIHRLCCATAEFGPGEWADEIEQKQISFHEMRSAPIEEIQKNLIRTYLEKLERESLLRKCDVLLRVLKPRSTRGVLTGFRYSRPRLAELDKLRHDAVHKLYFHRKCRQPRAKLEYLFKTGELFLNLVCKHLNIQPLMDKAERQRMEKIGSDPEMLRRFSAGIVAPPA